MALSDYLGSFWLSLLGIADDERITAGTLKNPCTIRMILENAVIPTVINMKAHDL